MRQNVDEHRCWEQIEIYVRYRGAIPEARTKWQAEKAETRIRLAAYENRYGGSSGDELLSEFIEARILDAVRKAESAGLCKSGACCFVQNLQPGN
jgi:hypothetical protein